MLRPQDIFTPISEDQKKEVVRLIGEYLRLGLPMNKATSNAMAVVRGQPILHQPPCQIERARQAAERCKAMEPMMKKWKEEFNRLIVERPDLTLEEIARLATQIAPLSSPISAAGNGDIGDTR